MRISIIVVMALLLAGGVFAKDPNLSPGVPTPGGRVGGETIETATVIASLPYNDADNSCMYADHYDEACPYTGSMAGDAVYAYTPMCDGLVNITLCNGSDYDTKLFVYQDMHTPGNPYACNDDECPGYVSELMNLQLALGHTYYIVVDGWSSSCGNYIIDMWGDEASPAESETWGSIKNLFQ